MAKEQKLAANGNKRFGILDSLSYAAGDFGCNMSFALKARSPSSGRSLWVWGTLSTRSVGSMIGNMVPMVILPFLIWKDRVDETGGAQTAEVALNMRYLVAVLFLFSAVLNWFDITMPEGRFSLNDTLEDIMATFRGKMWFAKLASKLLKGLGNKKGGGNNKQMINEGMMKMMGGFTVIRLTSLVGAMNINFTKEELLKMNRQLNRIKKPKKK